MARRSRLLPLTASALPPVPFLVTKTLNLGTFFLNVFQGKKVDGAANAYAINVSQKRKYRFVPGPFNFGFFWIAKEYL